MPTKQQVEGLIERLADYKKYRIMCGYHTTIDIPRDDSCKDCEWEYRDILIGTLLEKMKEKNILYANAPSPREGDNAGWILDYWSKCGFSRSLQEIINECGWSTATDFGYENSTVFYLKSPEASALFSFLLHLFPINNENN